MAICSTKENKEQFIHRGERRQGKIKAANQRPKKSCDWTIKIANERQIEEGRKISDLITPTGHKLKKRQIEWYKRKTRRLPRNKRGTLIRVIALKGAFDREFFFFRESEAIELSCERPFAVGINTSTRS